MTVKGVKGYVLVTLTGLYIVAAIILVLLNIKNTAVVYFGQNLHHSTGRIMIYSALVGFSFYWALKWMFIGIKSIRTGTMQDKVNRVGKLEKLAKSQSAKPQENQQQPE